MSNPSPQGSELRAAAAEVEATHQAIHILQDQLTSRLTELDARAPGLTEQFICAFAQFDRELEQVKARLDELHARLVGPAPG